MLPENIKTLLYKWLITVGFKVILICLAVIITDKIITIALNRFSKSLGKEDENYSQRIQTLFSISKSVLKFIIAAIGLMLILQVLGINIGPILAAAGVAGIAIGFGSQRLVEDFISGFIMLINNQIRVGDVVQVNDKSGVVENFTLNTVILRDLSGNVHFIRNGKIDIITNMTKDYSYALFDIGVSYKEDMDKIKNVLYAIGEEMSQREEFSNDILAPIEVLGIDKFEDSAVIVKARIKTKPNKQWNIQREFNFRLKKKFDENGIEMPFPQSTVHIVQKN